MIKKVSKAEDLFVRYPADEVRVTRFGEALEIAGGYGQYRRDWVVSGEKINLSNDGNFSFRGGKSVRPKKARSPIEAMAEVRAVKGLVDLMKVPGMGGRFILENDPEAAAWNLNHFLASSGKSYTIRGVGRQDGPVVVRAFASERYNTDIDSFEILQIMADVTYKENGKVLRLFPDDMPVAGRVSRDRLSMRIPFPAFTREINDMRGGGTSPYTGGVSISNGETRNGRFLFTPFAMRTACENSIYVPEWEDIGVDHRHYGRNLTAAMVVAEIVSAIGTFIHPDSEINLNHLLDTLAAKAMREMTVDGVLKDIAKFTNAFGGGEDVSMQLAQTAADYEPGPLAVVNAITQYAHLLPTSALADQAQTMAGRYLFTGKFGTITEEDAADDLADLFFQPAVESVER